jgi:hypothetical protein
MQGANRSNRQFPSYSALPRLLRIFSLTGEVWRIKSDRQNYGFAANPLVQLPARG